MATASGAWKIELVKLAAETRLTSKWNKIEHPLFSEIIRNWAVQPQRTHQIIVNLIGNTTTATGLTVQCVLDTDEYPTGLRYTPKDLEALPITLHEFHGEWNCTMSPTDAP